MRGGREKERKEEEERRSDEEGKGEGREWEEGREGADDLGKRIGSSRNKGITKGAELIREQGCTVHTVRQLWGQSWWSTLCNPSQPCAILVNLVQSWSTFCSPGQPCAMCNPGQPCAILVNLVQSYSTLCNPDQCNPTVFDLACTILINLVKPGQLGSIQVVCIVQFWSTFCFLHNYCMIATLCLSLCNSVRLCVIMFCTLYSYVRSCF